MSGAGGPWFGRRAVEWVLDEAPNVPPNLVSTLVGLARHAQADGTGAAPSVDTLMTYTRKSRRQVKYDLDKLRELKLIEVSDDQSRVQHIRADRRPTVYNLAMPTTCNPLHPVDERGATDCTPQTGPDETRGAIQRSTGCNTASDGVQPIAPEEDFEKNKEKNNPSLPPAVIGEVVVGEIVEEGDGSISSEEHISTLVDEVRAMPGRRTWKVNDLRREITDAAAMLDGNLTVVAELVRATAADPTTIAPSRITAGGNPHLQRATSALTLMRAVERGTLPVEPVAGAHPFDRDTDGTCKVCLMPEANARHRTPSAPRQTNAGNGYKPWRNPTDPNAYNDWGPPSAPRELDYRSEL